MAQLTEFVLLLGLEQYSRDFFKQVEVEVRKEVPNFRLHLFEDRDTMRRPAELEAAISRCACLFTALMTLAEYAEWLVPTVQRHDPPVVFAFEGLPEVMKLTKVGSYVMHEAKGMPRPVQNIARLMVGGREEDTFYGYVKLQKITSKLLNFIPGKRLHDVRNWTNVSTYWSNRSVPNMANMFKLILREYCGVSNLHVAPPLEIPTMGFAHPDAPKFFTKPEEFERWERTREPRTQNREPKSLRSTQSSMGTIAVLSFRSHILGGTSYHNEVVRALEAGGMRVIPIFCMGIEAHVAVREWLSQMKVDVVINTMGFPLVGGPAGSIKAGMTVQKARELLAKLDVPYIVAQPLFIQDLEHWQANGVNPIQTTILYSLPEMDGAVAPVVLGGMQGSAMVTLPDRMERLVTLARSFARLRRKANQVKKVAIVVYNYPPGMGQTATAALLDVPASLVALLRRLRAAGYDVGHFPDDPATLAKCIAGSIEIGDGRPFDAAQGRLETGAGQLPPNHPPLPEPVVVGKSAFYDLVSPKNQDRINGRWGAFPGDIAPAGRDGVFLGGMQLGNVYIGVQPMIGMPGDPMRLLFDKENTPHHQYALFYRWISEEFGADAIIHMGMHGTAEWMPGLQLGLTGDCWPDLLLGSVPNFYVYPINNPAEANIAKRRGFSTIIGHAIPPYGRAGLYKELQALRDLLEDYRERRPVGSQPFAVSSNSVQRNGDSDDQLPTANGLLETEEAILQKLALLNLDVDLVQGVGESFAAFASRVYAYLRQLEQTLIVDSLHVLGSAPPAEQQLTIITEALKAERNGEPGLANLILDFRLQIADWPESNATNLQPPIAHLNYADLLTAARRGDGQALVLRDAVDAACTAFVQHTVFEGQSAEKALQHVTGDPSTLLRAGRRPETGDRQTWKSAGKGAVHLHSDNLQSAICTLQSLSEQGRAMLAALRDNTVELDFLLHGLDGGYIPAAPGGDIIRDGMAVLPTGRNIHSLDPFRVPTDAAFNRGRQIAEALLAAHRAENDGAYPETIAQVLWGLDCIKTKGESIGVVLGLIGARPHKDGQGKVGRYELIPLAELGRPRVDVLMTASGVFRDTFAGVMDLLDRLVREAASADEPEEQNFIRKHVQASMAQGAAFESATARIFTQAAGTYGTDVDEAIEGGAWQERQELEDLFVKRNAYAFGGNKGGAALPQVFNHLLGTVGRVAQEIDSVEYGLTDMQHYYGYSGALKAAAERRTGKTVKLSYVETYTAETKVQDLEQVLRVEYRTKLLNPKWYEGMLKHGHNGAAEIASRFTYMLGWSATTGGVDNWVYDRAAETFVLDDAMRQRLEAANPQAARNAVSRLLEANDRGVWQADDDTLDRLREIYADLEDRLEGVV
ncbi:MAG: magnesium chelatase subunit H [Chloroflexaceae bacterium]|nr:magnesium chelatase subunit H [Chloroflexaceae bacterium]